MLDSLRSIVQEVNTADHLQSVLDITVARVQDTMGTEVCSIYLRESTQGRYVFSATEGLNKEFVGKISMAPTEGLVGQVAAREEPLNLENAESHPQFLFMPGIGEERYSAFLGVPIIHQRNVLGVLVIQQQTRRRFDEDDEAFLVTVSAQLAGVIAHAQATGLLVALDDSGERQGSARFRGVAGAPGIAIGHAIVVAPTADLNSVPMRRSKDIQDELDFFHECLEAVREDIKALGRKLATRLAKEERALFDVYLSMLADDALAAEVDVHILQGEWAQGALSKVILKHVRTFEMMEDAYLKERATDVKDLGRRVLSYLQAANSGPVDYPERTVLVGEELTASMLGEVPPENLVGLISVRGSSNSHVAILARSMGIPTVMGAVDLPYTQIEGSEIILDGYNGHVYFNPSAELQHRFQTIYEEELQFSKELEALKDEPCVTTDDYRLPLWVNTGLQADIARSLDRGAEGVGLFRTEVPFLLRERFPSEEEQRKIYRDQLEAFAPMPVTMRTLDVGGDKSLPYFPIEEDNPFLGWRGIRVTLDHPEIFLVQVRAMMKANAGLGNLRIMLPMISSVPELEEALELIYRAHDELVEELDFELELPLIGVMVEVPAAVYQARQFAKRVGFLSVGSNDLTQYLLAVDRNNARVADIYQTFHPAVLQALQHVVNDGHAEGRKVSICGELAGEPGAAVLLMAMGYDVLSMNATTLPKVKSVIRNISMKKAKEMLAHVMTLENAAEIREYMEQSIQESSSQRLAKAMMVDSAH
ncbi:MAG: phosphoenolpyruvate--protein phosphotransferase [Oceanicoccus sp.]|uniref:phosphoenolpyruvate--protein phosphotransferase n=1 Tax=Oceanicoccus sp. TaxID=2691044 RepID=UPI0026256936|nr:phosphoenolpyruvate--protein phosphotransferase [Oceanicoccus sp.]MCP3906603.1 phosphoenolpyruvate--protein phosphotransferase [Oceanicoccus sp.]MDG1772751.1 phosphoenolpyruvate--protein phosphotransferase [Oceanicoccus sp.]